jgi:hypothetical protein
MATFGAFAGRPLAELPPIGGLQLPDGRRKRPKMDPEVKKKRASAFSTERPSLTLKRPSNCT